MQCAVQITDSDGLESTIISFFNEMMIIRAVEVSRVPPSH